MRIRTVITCRSLRERLNVNRPVRGRCVAGMRPRVNVEQTVIVRPEPGTRLVWVRYEQPFGQNMTRRHRSHRPTNGSITASYRPTVLILSSYRPHTGFSPFSTACTYTVLGMPKTFSLTGLHHVYWSLNALPCAHTVFHGPHGRL